jgi:hypothetical protein
MVNNSQIFSAFIFSMTFNGMIYKLDSLINEIITCDILKINKKSDDCYSYSVALVISLIVNIILITLASNFRSSEYYINYLFMIFSSISSFCKILDTFLYKYYLKENTRIEKLGRMLLNFSIFLIGNYLFFYKPFILILKK